MNTNNGFVDIRMTWYRKSMRSAAADAGGRSRTKTKSLPLLGGNLIIIIRHYYCYYVTTLSGTTTSLLTAIAGQCLLYINEIVFAILYRLGDIPFISDEGGPFSDAESADFP